jgi:hypothetical protein
LSRIGPGFVGTGEADLLRREAYPYLDPKLPAGAAFAAPGSRENNRHSNSRKRDRASIWTPQTSKFAAKQPGNYMEYRHGDLGFGKLTMKDPDLILIDLDPPDPFDFYLAHY